MANISSAFGTIALTGDWTPTMIDNFNILNREWGGYYYGAYADDFSEKELTQSFNADGRWAYANNLEFAAEQWANSDDPAVSKALSELIDDMRKKPDTAITFDYAEEESGCAFIQTVASELKPAAFELSRITERHADEIIINAGAFKIHLPLEKDLENILELTPDGSKYRLKLNSTEYFLTTYGYINKNYPRIITNKDGEQTVFGGFAEIVFNESEPISDFGEYIGTSKNGFDYRFMAEISDIYFSAYTLGHAEILSIDYDYTAENLLALGLECDIQDIFEQYSEWFEIDDADNIKCAKEFFSEYYDAFIEYLAEEKSD